MRGKVNRVQALFLRLLPGACVLIHFVDSDRMKSVCDLHHVLSVIFEVLRTRLCESSECCVCCDISDACLVEEGALKQVACWRAVGLMVRIHPFQG